MLKQNNVLNIEGIVSEINVREINKGSKKYICGDMSVEVNRAKKDGTVEQLIVPVSFISADTTSAGAANMIYTNLQNLKEYHSIAEVGREQATRVRINGAKLTENTFVLPTDLENPIRGVRIQSSFFTKINENTNNNKADFSLTMVVIEMKNEEKASKDANGDVTMLETGRLIITGGLPTFNNNIDVIDFVIEDKKNIDFITSHWKKGDTVMASGYPRFSVETINRVVETGFGEPMTDSYTRRVKEFVITGGSGSGLEEELAYPADEITEALGKRKVRNENIKEKAKQKAESDKAAANSSTTIVGGSNDWNDQF